jgi:hypothetical protein
MFAVNYFIGLKAGANVIQCAGIIFAKIIKYLK